MIFVVFGFFPTAALAVSVSVSPSSPRARKSAGGSALRPARLKVKHVELIYQGSTWRFRTRPAQRCGGSGMSGNVTALDNRGHEYDTRCIKYARSRGQDQDRHDVRAPKLGRASPYFTSYRFGVAPSRHMRRFGCGAVTPSHQVIKQKCRALGLQQHAISPNHTQQLVEGAVAPTENPAAVDGKAVRQRKGLRCAGTGRII